MYEDWVACNSLGVSWTEGDADSSDSSVLSKLTAAAARDIVQSVSQCLASSPSSDPALSKSPTSTRITDESDVTWCMHVIYHGLSLPLNDLEILRDCVDIYCKWLTALTPPVRSGVPLAVVSLPHVFCPRVIRQLTAVFVPRAGSTQDSISRQVVLCHRVLRSMHSLTTHKPLTLSPSVWSALLIFHMRAADVVLAPPFDCEDLGQHLCDRVLTALFDAWLRACHHCFPPPQLWRLLTDTCRCWRHRRPLIRQWRSMMTALTARLNQDLFDAEHSQSRCEQSLTLPEPLLPVVVAQVWYRMLHLLGSPVELADVSSVSGSQQFLRYAIASETVVEPCQHPCLLQLPAIFDDCVATVAHLVDMMLALVNPSNCDNTTDESGLKTERLVMENPISAGNAGAKREVIGRPSCNSIVQVFGVWLFEASALGSYSLNSRSDGRARVKRPSTVFLDHGIVSSPSVSAAVAAATSADQEDADSPAALQADAFVSGRACALGALCRVFCSRQTREDISPTYLAAFYRVLSEALSLVSTQLNATDCNTTCASVPVSLTLLDAVLVNGWPILQLDLDGVNCLLPLLVDAVRPVLAPSLSTHPLLTEASLLHLRRPAVRLLVSALPLPLHFQSLQIRCCTGSSSTLTATTATTFLQLWPRLVELLMTAIQQEQDPLNCRLLLAAVWSALLDTVAHDRSSGSEATTDAGSVSSVSSIQSPMCPAESACGLYVRLIHMVSHRLMASWRSDFGTSLAAIDLLTALAGVRLSSDERLEARNAVKYLCDFFCQQCARPPPCHSRDLHSTMVAALRCISAWFLHHPCILDDAGTLRMVLLVVELGISGSVSPPTSFTEDGQPLLRPVSLRVREAAEALLHVLLEQVGTSGVGSGDSVASISGRLHENHILEHCQHGSRFTYVVCGGDSVLLALLEQPPGNEQRPLPAVTVVARGPTLRSTWMLQLRHQPRHRATDTLVAATSNPGRPLPTGSSKPEKGTASVSTSGGSCFGWSLLERVQHCRVDESVPSVESLVNESSDRHRHILRLLEQQRAACAEPSNHCSAGAEELECTPPAACQEFQTARLLLRHLQLLGCGGESRDDTRGNLTSMQQAVLLDSSRPGFFDDLRALDAIGCRPRHLVLAFYVPAGRLDTAAILAGNESGRAGFTRLLLSLGHSVSTASLCDDAHTLGDHLNTGSSNEKVTAGNGGAACFDGSRQVLYWSNALTELLLATPVSAGVSALPEPLRSLSASVALVWLESYDDWCRVPVRRLCALPSARPVCAVVFVHPLRSHLFRIRVTDSAGSPSTAGSVSRLALDGLVVSGTALADCVRHLLLCVCQQRQLDMDLSSVSHVQRRHKIQQLKQRYQVNSSLTSVLIDFFQSQCSYC